MPGRSLAAAVAVVVLAAGLAACGGDGAGSAASQAPTLTIYSSLPLQGPSAATSLSIINAEKLALVAAGGRVGGFVVKYVSLDDSGGPAGWAPQAVSVSARKAAQDLSTIGYLGDLDSGATAVSLPIVNAAGILQISPASTAVGLTRRPAPGDGGEPEQYYPSGRRTFGRLLAADDVQAAAQVTYQLAEGCRSTFVVHDGGSYGTQIAAQVVLRARARGLRIAGDAAIDPRGPDRTVVRRAAASRADCVFFGGRNQPGVVSLFRDLHAARPAATLFGADGIADAAFTRRLGAGVAARVRLTTPVLGDRLYPPAGREFVRVYRRTFGTVPAPLAIYGFESMRLMLQAIRDAGPRAGDKQAVIDAFFRVRNRESVLGRYSIAATGDNTSPVVAAATVRGGAVRIQKVIRVRPGR